MQKELHGWSTRIIWAKFFVLWQILTSFSHQFQKKAD